MKVQIKQLLALVLMLAGMVLVLSLMPERDITAEAPHAKQLVGNFHH